MQISTVTGATSNSRSPLLLMAGQMVPFAHALCIPQASEAKSMYFRHRYSLWFLTLTLSTWYAIGSSASAQGAMQSAAASCPQNDSGLKLPAGFCATIFADGIGHARHLVVAPNVVVYVNTWSGRYYGNDTPHAGGFLVALQDTSGAGKADVIERFGETVQSGGAGGTGIGLYKGGLFAEINDKIVRYALPAGSIVPQGPAVPVV